MNFETKLPFSTDTADLDENTLTFDYPSLNLYEGNDESEKVSFFIEKFPINIEKGLVYGSPSGVLIDDSIEVETLREKVRALRDKSENEKIHEVMEIVRECVKYAYPATVEELRGSNPALSSWIEDNINNGEVVKLSELLKNGYGECRHLSVLYLYLAQEVGLEGVLLKSDPSNAIVNILRTDNSRPLFKLVDIGDKAPSHTWVEVRNSSGKWVPIDPSTNLIGDTEEGLEMFNKANYMAMATVGLEARTRPQESLDGLFEASYFKPGVSTTLGNAKISRKKSLDWDTGKITYSFYQGSAELTIFQGSSYIDSNFRVRKK